MFQRSLPPPSCQTFRSWLVHVSGIEIWSPKISHRRPAEFLGRGIMYNKTVGKVISLRESCNFSVIDFLKITHCLRAVKANLTRKMSLFRTPWLAIVINSYNYYWLRGGFSFVKMLLQHQAVPIFTKETWGANPGAGISESPWRPHGISERPLQPPWCVHVD